MSTGSSAVTSGVSDATVFRNPTNAGGLLSLPDELTQRIASYVLFSEHSPAVRDLAALAGSCWQLHGVVCSDPTLQPVTRFFSNLQRRKFTYYPIDMSSFSGVQPAGRNRLIAYKENHSADCVNCSHRGKLDPACREASCTITVLDTKYKKKPYTFNLPGSSSRLHVLGNNELFLFNAKKLRVINFETDKSIRETAFRSLVNERQEFVAAAPCAGGKIAYAVALKNQETGDRCDEGHILGVWNPVRPKGFGVALDLPKGTEVRVIQTYGNVVLAYTTEGYRGNVHVEIWDLDAQNLYSSRRTAAFDGRAPLSDTMFRDLTLHSCIICDHKLVVVKEELDSTNLYVWDYVSDQVTVNPLPVYEDPSSPPLRTPLRLTPSPCGKWVTILYNDGQFEACSLEQPQNGVVLRKGTGEDIKAEMYIPSSTFQYATPCIAVGRRVLFNIAEKACFGIWDPQKPRDPITTVSLGDQMLLIRDRGGVEAVVGVRDAATGESTICLPTQNMISLGGSSILFGCVPQCDRIIGSYLLVQSPSPPETILPLMVWDFDVQASM